LRQLRLYAEAEEAYLHERPVLEKLVVDFPEEPEYRRRLAICYTSLAGLLGNIGKRKPEEESFRRQALAVRTKLAQDFPAVPAYRHELARNYNELGRLLQSLDQEPNADAAFRQELTVRVQLAHDFPSIAGYQVELARNYVALASPARAKGRNE